MSEHTNHPIEIGHQKREHSHLTLATYKYFHVKMRNYAHK